MPQKLEWTPELLDTLRTERNAGTPLYLVAERLGVTYEAAVLKARELNLAQRMNRGRIPGSRALQTPRL